MDKRSITFTIIHNQKEFQRLKDAEEMKEIRARKRKIKEKKPREFSEKARMLKGSENAIIQSILHYDVGQKLDLHPSKSHLIAKHLRPIIKKMKANHQKCSYTMHANHIKDHPRDPNIKIPVNTMQKYFRGIVIKVLPVELFGNSNNRERFSKTIRHYLSLAKGETLHLPQLVKKMNMTAIKWLANVDDPKIQTTLLLKCIKWLFSEFIDKVVDKFFYVGEAFVGSASVIFMRHCDWQNTKRAQFREIKVAKLKQERAALLPVANRSEPKLFFHCKPTNKLRPIAHVRYTKEEKLCNATVNTFLHQLALTRFKLLHNCDFEKRFMAIQNGNSAFGKCRKLYLVKTDVKNAFGSVNKLLLWKRLLEMCKGIPRTLTLTKYTNSWNRKREWFTNKQLALPQRAAKWTRQEKSIAIEIESILKQLKTYLFDGKFTFDQKSYQLVDGLIQGGALSAILSDIFYAMMAKHHMRSFRRTGILFKFADDFLYVTAQPDQAKSFLKTIRKGIPDYNCKFNKHKTETNFDPKTMELNGNDVNYLNNLIKGDTLEIQPVFAETPRLTTDLSSQRRFDKLVFFKRRLMNLTPLKLSGLSLSKFNSDGLVLCTLEKMATYLAKRCLLFLTVFPDLEEPLLKKVFKIISLSAKKVQRRVVILRKDHTRRFRRLVRIVIWTCYKRVFSTNAEMYKMFVNFIKKKLALSKNLNKRGRRRRPVTKALQV